MSYFKKNKPKFFLQPPRQYFNEIWPVRKKVWPPLLYHIVRGMEILSMFVIAWEVVRLGVNLQNFLLIFLIFFVTLGLKILRL